MSELMTASSFHVAIFAILTCLVNETSQLLRSSQNIHADVGQNQVDNSTVTFPNIQKFNAKMEIQHVQTFKSFSVEEEVFNDAATIKIKSASAQKFLATCSYSRSTGFGHKIKGVSCTPSVRLPQECFGEKDAEFSDVLDTYLPICQLLSKLITAKITKAHETFEEEGLTNFFKIQYQEQNLELKGLFSMEDANGTLQPRSIKIIVNGSFTWLYTISKYHELTSPEDAAKIRRSSGFSPAPQGVFCPRPDLYRRKIPEISDQFSVDIETTDQSDFSVTYSHQSYDLPDQIVAFRFSPRSHSLPSGFFSNFFATGEHISGQKYTVIHDFRTGLQFTIDHSTSNCTIDDIPIASSAADNDVLVASAHVRLKHAKEMLDVKPADFVYFGERNFRDIASDVWIAEQQTETEYRTTEIFFSRHVFNFYVEELNIVQEVPLGLKTYSAPNKNATSYDKVVESHYFNFNPSSPKWRDFDISLCVSEDKRLYLKMSIDVNHDEIILRFDRQITQVSLRKLIAGWAGVTPLRVVDIYFAISKPQGSAHDGSDSSMDDGMDVWFVLLERSFSINSRRKTFTNLGLADAYSQLAQSLANQSKEIIKLRNGPDRVMHVRVKPLSLELSSENAHPLVRNRKNNFIRPYFFLRASYTAGSMAGLGFSMAILGVSVGIFLGFLLWKRRIGLPPSYLHMSNPFQRVSSSPSGVLLNNSNSSTSQGVSIDEIEALPTPLTPPPRY